MAKLIINTDSLRGYADRIDDINYRMAYLDLDIKALYVTAFGDDLAKIGQADASAGYSESLSNCSMYLRETANEFDNAEKHINKVDPLSFDKSYEESLPWISQEELQSKKELLQKAEGKVNQVKDKIEKVDEYLRGFTGAAALTFTEKAGKVIVSEFARSSVLNSITKTFNSGTGIGTRYNPSTLVTTPGVGTLYALGKVGEAAGYISTGINVGIKIADGAIKIAQVRDDPTKSKGEKICQVAALGITSAAGAALDVAAPIAGKAVTSAITAAIPVPIVGAAVGIVAGAVVQDVIGVMADVVTSEKVVNQVSNSMANVGRAVASGTKAVSDAGKKVLESKNAKEAIKNTGKLVGTAVKAGTKVVAAAVVENVKVVTTVAKETAKAVVNKAKDVGKSIVKALKKW